MDIIRDDYVPTLYNLYERCILGINAVVYNNDFGRRYLKRRLAVRNGAKRLFKESVQYCEERHQKRIKYKLRNLK